MITYEDETIQKRRFLILECANENIENIFSVIKKHFCDLYESTYLGFSSIILVLDISSSASSFEQFLKYIKNKIHDE